MKKYQGFTLLEVLVSVALFAIMAAMAYAGLNHIIRSSAQIKASNQAIAELQFSLFSIENDVLQLVHRPIRDDYGDTQPALLVSKEKLELTRTGWQNFLQQTRSNLQRVSYTVEDDQLTRHFWLNLDHALEQQAVSSVILKEVVDIEFNVVDQQGKTYQSWPPTTDQINVGEDKQTVLKYLTVLITTKHLGEITKLIELDWHEQ